MHARICEPFYCLIISNTDFVLNKEMILLPWLKVKEGAYLYDFILSHRKMYI